MASARVHDRQLLAIGAVCAAGGVYFLLAGADVTAPPGSINGPQWLAACVGLIFLAGGVMVLVRGWLNVPDSAEDLPADAPRVLVALQWLAAVAACAALASAASWVAFGAGPRHFLLPIPIWGAWAETIGRAAFAIGAVIAWLITAAYAGAGARALFARKR